ncbi:MAG: FAD-binding oxidoreductase [Anaerolineales bacterium]|nr:FAD-binding oxidoreductase [Anaerolineales bacterium]
MKRSKTQIIGMKKNDRSVVEAAEALKKRISGEVQIDAVSKLLYSTDASIYQIKPLGVVFPKHVDELQAIMETALEYALPVLPRGAGSSLAGQAVGEALIIDCFRYLQSIDSIDPETLTAVVEPGVVLDTFNRQAVRYGLQYGPDPASSNRATFGGVLGCNASGAHSIYYGMASDNIISTSMVLSDGSLGDFGETSLNRAVDIAAGRGRQADLYRFALGFREGDVETFKKNWPKVWRKASGYNLNYLLGWSPLQPALWQGAEYPPHRPGFINLAPLFVGAEGTLGIYCKATIRLVEKPKNTVLGILTYDSLPAACDAAGEFIHLSPSSIELIPRSLTELAAKMPAYSRHLDFIMGTPEALLVIEFSGNDPLQLQSQLEKLGSQAIPVIDTQQQAHVWEVRKVGLNLLMSRAGDLKPQPFVEDVTVPLENLGSFVREVQQILVDHGTNGDFYGHASAGCLHIRPLVNLKTVDGVEDFKSILKAVTTTTIRFGGVISGEHGDGIVRSSSLEENFGPEIMQVFRELKQAADPQVLLNPGKIIDPYPVDENLRYGAGYWAEGWQPVFDFSSQANLEGAIEMCNGAGVCMKPDPGVMCPSFRALRNEMHSPRGRSNVMRALISGRYAPDIEQEEMIEIVREALDMCLECKGCKNECPSSVDVAKLKYEFLNHYYRSHRRPIKDYLFGYIGSLTPIGSALAPMANLVTNFQPVRWLAEKTIGIAQKAQFPTFHFSAGHPKSISIDTPGPEVILLLDAFNEAFYPHVSRFILRLLARCGCKVQIFPIIGAGRTYISKGFLPQAKNHASRVVAKLKEMDPDAKIPVIGIEPSEIFSFRDEYLDLLPNDPYVRALAERSYMIDEFLLRPDGEGKPFVDRISAQTKPVDDVSKVFLHGHCYQKAQPPASDGLPSGVKATRAVLEACGFSVEEIPSGCCGMAGSFGFEKDHYPLSMQIGEEVLFPAVRGADELTERVVAAGVSCRGHIEDGTGKMAEYPLVLLDKYLS